MKRAEVKVGMPVMLSLGRRGATRVTVTETIEDMFSVQVKDGYRLLVSARRLSPVPVTDANGAFIGYEHELAAAS